MPKSLQQRAEEQFDRRSDLRVLFLFDPEEDHRSEIDGWEHPEIRRIESADPGFELIYRIEEEWTDERILLYAPHARPRDLAEYPLAYLLVANAELNVDEAAELADELDLRSDQRSLIDRYYRSDLQYKNRKEFLAGILNKDRLTKKTLRRGLAAYHLDLFSTAPSSLDHLVAGVFIKATDAEAFESYRKKCEDRDLAEPLGRRFARSFALDRSDFSRETIEVAAQKLKYNLLTQPIEKVSPDDTYHRRLNIEQPNLLAQMSTLVQKWESNRNLTPSYEEVLEVLAPEVEEKKLLDAYGADATFGYFTPALRRERLRRAASLLPEQPAKSRESIRELRDSSDAGAAAVANALWHMASFYIILRDEPALDFSELQDFVDAYISDLYPCDAHYRKAVRAFQTVRDRYPEYREVLEDAFRQFCHVYPGEFVQPLNTAWQQALEEKSSASRSLQTNPLHTFYQTFLGPEVPKTAVIVSDGLRYEIAAELSGRLQRDKRKQSSLEALFAPIPSITSLGKASLLPHESLRWDGNQFLADGESTSGTKQRESVLQNTRDEARALRFEEIRELNTSEGRELFKSHPLIYIYHDRIDRYGDKADTETDTPEAVERTIGELENLIQTLNNWNVYRVIVTADHGFLYSELITEAMQESFPETSPSQDSDEVIRRNRCLLAPSIAGSDGYRFPVRDVSNLDSDWVAAVPRAVNRYRLAGAGKQYAHGGASLQELIVPVVEVRKGRKDKAEKVDVRLVSKDNIITSGVLKIQITQTTSVSQKRRPRTLVIGLYDEQENVVSNQEILVFDSSSSDPAERTENVLLKLNPEANDLNSCRLRAFDRDDTNRLNPVIDQRFVIRRLFDQDDF